MRRWDGLVDRYLALCQARGLAQGTLDKRAGELVRFGVWLKRRRPRPRLEDIDSEVLVAYIGSRAAFHARATVAGIVSELRGMGEFLAQEGVWCSNPLRWMRGPKLDPRQTLPRRIGTEQLKKVWDAAQNRQQEYSCYQAVCILAILYGTGLRRGELERLDLGPGDAPATSAKAIDFEGILS